MRSNKFNIHWQIVRVKARSIKDVDAKVDFVMDFLNSNKNVHNKDRVSNWLKMTSYANKDRSAFDVEINGDFILEDLDNDLSKVDLDNLKLVFKDLSKRKYGFQYKSVPLAHTEFMIELKKELDNRC